MGPTRAELDDYEKRSALLCGLAFVVHNPGKVLIDDLRIVTTVPKVPELHLSHGRPRSPVEFDPLPTFAPSPIETRVKDRGENWELSARLGKVQPNATVWSAEFWVGSSVPREMPLLAGIFADNISDKTEVALRIRIDVKSGYLSRIHDDTD